MGYTFTIDATEAIRIKVAGHYPWPASNGTLADRTIEIDRDDVLTKSEDGTYMRHTGLGCFHIVLTPDQVEPWGQDKRLRLL